MVLVGFAVSTCVRSRAFVRLVLAVLVLAMCGPHIRFWSGNGTGPTVGPVRSAGRGGRGRGGVSDPAEEAVHRGGVGLGGGLGGGLALLLGLLEGGEGLGE